MSVSDEDIPYFNDDMDYGSLNKSIKHSIAYLKKQPSDTCFLAGSIKYSNKHLLESLIFFLDIINTSPTFETLNQQIRQHFDVYQAAGVGGWNFDRHMLVTGYYRPLFEGSLVKDAKFKYPLYKQPLDLIVEKGLSGGKTSIGRFENGRLVSYWTRREIEQGAKASGSELIWLQDPMDAFAIHVQGSALIRLRDNTIRGIHYAISNGRKYSSIGKYLVDTGRMKLEDANMASIRDYIRAHPQERDEILFHNDSYIFFRWTDARGATGALGEELTPGRSIAADKSIFPAAGLGFLASRRPVTQGEQVVQWIPMNRFVTLQDSGSAIRGPGRVDLFWGTGNAAGFTAGHMKEEGALYFLLLKQTSQEK